MVSFKSNAKNYRDAESMAAAYLAAYFANSKIKYPLNPFKMLKDEGVEFKICNFNKLEGVYIPCSVTGRYIYMLVLVQRDQSQGKDLLLHMSYVIILESR